MSDSKGLISRITSAASSAAAPIKGAVDLAKEINNLNVDYNVKSKTIDLLDNLLDARQGQMLLSELLEEAKNRIIELESLLKKKQEWVDEKSKYEIHHPIPKTVVYRLRQSDNPQFTPHYLCATCYESDVKSILQYKTTNLAYITMLCHKCNSEYKFPLEQ